MPIRHAVLTVLCAVFALWPLAAPATDTGTRYEQEGEHYDVSISYPVLQHAAVNADIDRIVWKLTDAFRRAAGRGLPPQPAAGPDSVPRTGTDTYASARRDWLTATYRLSRPSAKAISVIFEIETGMWGQDGVAVSRNLLAVSYDLAAGRRIEIADLFGDDGCADAVLASHLRPYGEGAEDAHPGMKPGGRKTGDPARPDTSTVAPTMVPQAGGAETPVTFWLTPRGLMLSPGSDRWRNAFSGGSSSLPDAPPMDAGGNPADPPPAVEVPLEPLRVCSPHLSYWSPNR